MLRDWKEGISMAHGIWMQPWHMAGHAMALSCTNYSLWLPHQFIRPISSISMHQSWRKSTDQALQHRWVSCCPLWAGVLPESETLPRSILRLSTLQGDLGQATERILGRKEKFTDWQMFSTVKLRSWRQQVFHSFFALLLVMDWWRLVDGSLSEDRSTTLSLFLSLKPRFFPIVPFSWALPWAMPEGTRGNKEVQDDRALSENGHGTAVWLCAENVKCTLSIHESSWIMNHMPRWPGSCLVMTTASLWPLKKPRPGPIHPFPV